MPEDSLPKRVKTRKQAAARVSNVPRARATLTTSQVRRQVQQWRTLKARFDRTHRAGLAALEKKDYARLGAAIVHERRIIKELRVPVDLARAQVGQWKIVSRRLQAKG